MTGGITRRIGIDVGGTNTDAVLIEDERVVYSVKRPTTEDVTGGVVAALAAVRAHPGGAGAVDAVVIGTTHFINAVVQRRALTKVAAIRIGLPASASLPPFCDWPADLAALVEDGVHGIEGGHEFDGRPFMPLDTAGLRAAARAIRDSGVTSVAVASVFSPLDPSCEQAAREILAEICPDVSVTLSYDLGRIGLLERENAALLNAALRDLARTTVAGFRAAMARSGIAAPLYLTQNDGTVMDADVAIRFPVMSFASGATNSMRGAAHLSGLSDAMVVDVGGTTSDFGQFRNGFPREANAVVEVGGVRTLFRMPDLLSIGVGGGSRIGADGAVGPLSVGYALPREARIFGGPTLTASDVAVAAGLADFGARDRLADLDPALVAAALATIRTRIEDGVDRMKMEAGDVPLIAVGGGAFLVPDGLAGVSEVIRVPHGDCANAVGAAIAQVSGEVDQVFSGVGRAEALAEAERIARSRAIAAGAEAASVATVEIEDVPLAYLPGGALRVRARAAGRIAPSAGPRPDGGPAAQPAVATRAD
ncbi:MAG: hydantoinase [Rhodovulum sulfidophilum]|uniref:Hydantoinase n=1 Tax=Rhodovulum sulfidophilum TaxID=35806 RepID=A0A2W5N266_RHOSU|nr:MAG: hydantoinase [Rhodovulum sulfidophilum]